MFVVPNFEIIEFTDPICVWSWGSEPILKKLEISYPHNLKISYVTGGLIEDIRIFRDDINDIGGDIEKSNKNLAMYYLDASKVHNMPVCVENIKIFSKDYYSSYPANIAYHAVKMQSEKIANKYLRRLREAHFTEGAQISNPKILVELAKDVGVKIGDFLQAFEDGSAENLFQNDLLYTKQNKIYDFPSFLIRNNFNGKSIILRGFQSYNSLKQAIESLAEGEIFEIKIDKSIENILKYLQDVIKITPMELKMIFDMTDQELNKILKSLKKQGLITLEDVGTSSFIYYIGKALSCDILTGICEF